jgi:DNA-binding NarL/FixJ family response regulator
MIRILLADDHAAVRRGFRRILSTDEACDICAEAMNGEDAIALAVERRPSVVILDVFMPLLSGIEAARRIHALLPDTEIAIVTMHDDDELRRAASAAGARAFLYKSEADEHLLAAVHALAEHRPYVVARRDAEPLPSQRASGS